MWNLPVFVAVVCFRAPALYPLEVSELMNRATLFGWSTPVHSLAKLHMPIPKPKLAEIEKEKIDAYYGYFVPLGRTDFRKHSTVSPPGPNGSAVFKILNSRFFSLLYGRRPAAKDERDNKQNQKDDEQNVGNPRGFTGNTAQS
jgi:hypothetical protein